MLQFLRYQESLVKIARNYGSNEKEKLREYVKIVINLYDFLSEFGLEDAGKKIEYYQQLLDELGDV